jgi:uncharacterized secreted protein with C-terminal beta-propeller domain
MVARRGGGPVWQFVRHIVLLPRVELERAIQPDGRVLVLAGGAIALDANVNNLNVAVANDATFSSTNVQVAGVDEADLVETDGNYLYILSGQDLVIAQAGVGDALRVTSRVHLDQKPAGMYLTGNRLAIVSTSGGAQSYGQFQPLVLQSIDVNYDTLTEPTTTVTVLDVTDRSAPTMVQKTEMDGQLVSSRVVDGELRLVLSNSLDLPMPIARPTAGGELPATGEGTPVGFPLLGSPIYFDDIATNYWQPYSQSPSVYETQAEYLARVKDEILKSAMPQVRILAADGSVLDERALSDATDVYRPDSLLDRNMTTIATFDLDANTVGPASTVSVMTGDTPKIYATADSVYLFSTASEQLTGDYYSYTGYSTNIQKFDFNAETHAIRLAATGNVSGQIANQFSADESDGYLRVVTSSGWGAGGQDLFVLKQDGAQLKVVGSVTGIATGEQLHAVRFMGDRAFIVTFRQVDPLFAVDLIDPTNPQLVGELSIPGVSGYLQPLDANHVLGVGRAMDPSGQMFSDLELSIFDISNLSEPQLSFTYDFDGGWSTTTPILADGWIPYTGDQHAAGYFPDAQIFAMPVTSMQRGNLDGVASTAEFEPGHGGLEVFHIDVAGGFTPLAFIEHDMLVNRAVEAGGYLFAISDDSVTVHDLANPATQLGALDLEAGAATALADLPAYQPLSEPIRFAQQADGKPTALAAIDVWHGEPESVHSDAMHRAIHVVWNDRHGSNGIARTIISDFDQTSIGLVSPTTVKAHVAADEAFDFASVQADDWSAVPCDLVGELAQGAVAALSS